jgi:hypothetical protein
MTVIHADNDLEYWARDYWLGHCEGFHVEDEMRELGVVEEVLGDEDEPDELVVRGGLFANRVYRIRVDAIRAVEPRTRRIVVHLERERAA